MSEGIWLVTSGDYIGQELAAEFGRLPPAFLPVGTRRLYEFQIERIGRRSPVFLTLPETFELPPEDLARLEDLGITILLVPERLTLGESVLYALNLISAPDQPVAILHGDTLIESTALRAGDFIGVAASGEGYSWAEVELDGDRILDIRTVDAGAPAASARAVACGFFAFRHSSELIRGITKARGSFIGGIIEYAKWHTLSALAVVDWHDFGHVQTFFRSRRVVTSARHFNSMRIDGRTARKSSLDADKMAAEVAWLQTLPPRLQIFSARLIDSGPDADGGAFYETEYGYLPTLAELFVYGKLGPGAWSQILRSCSEFLTATASSRAEEGSDSQLWQLAVAKTTVRLRQFAGQSGFDVDRGVGYEGVAMPSLIEIANRAAARVDFRSGRRACVMHGDFCFSNILYDSRMQRIRVIDPRGYVVSGVPSVYGDIRYDLAKFAHSVIGRYDQIIGGRYRLEASDSANFSIVFEQAPHQIWLENALESFAIDGVCAAGTEVLALTVCLFLSMLPLHSDRPDRQRAFIANVLRLYTKLQARNLDREAEAA